MSSPPSEPGHAAPPTGPVRPEQDQAYKKSQGGSRNSPPKWSPSQTAAKKSASLLTQALATNREAAQSPSSTRRFPTSPPPLSNPLPLPSQDDPQRRNGLNNNPDRLPTSKMAMVASAPATDLRTGVNVGSSPTSKEFNIPDFRGTNSSLMNHRQLLSRARGRGTSLERTAKERRVQEVPKGTYSTNPGDTGIAGPSAPISPTAPESISNNPPTEGVRAEYRSWRDARPVMAAEKAWSIGNQGGKSGQGGQVEKSVTEVLAGIEHNNRSRKASHSLGFFKEGLPEDQSWKWDNKNRGQSKEGTSRSKDLFERENARNKAEKGTYTSQLKDAEGSKYSAGGRSPLESPPERGSKAKLNVAQYSTRGPAAKEDYFGGASQPVDAPSDEQVRALPAQLLADIRKHHNLTPGAAKGSSFSSSIPVTESEKAKPVADDELSEVSQIVPEEETNNDRGELTQIRSAEDEDDSGEEQISSALFVPHQTPHESPERSRHGSDCNERSSLSDENRLDIANSQQWLEEHEVPSDEVDIKYVTQEGQSRTLQSPTRTTQKVLLATEKESLSPNDTPDIVYDSLDEGGYSTVGEESGADDPDTTPTGSVQAGHMLPSGYNSHIHDHQQKTKRPLEAIELIPYRHQVGGHTTMWRFSKRAVCKQLNNRENEFYERVERYHPELLKFLPRCVSFHSSRSSQLILPTLSLSQRPYTPVSSYRDFHC